MSSDETRIMVALPHLLGDVSEGVSDTHARTPCVGVPSMGHTHYGEALQTRVPPSVVVDDASHQPDTRARSRSVRPALVPQSTTAVRLPSIWGSWAALLPGRRRVARPLALALGLCIGVGAALLVSWPRAGGKSRTMSQQPAREIVVRASTPGGRPLKGVVVRAAGRRLPTDEAGRAKLLAAVPGPVSVQASCPTGHAGERLERTLSPAVFASSKSWSFELSCEPEVFRATIEVTTRGCGEMRVLVDGVDAGTTTQGRLVLLRRYRQSSALSVYAEPLSGPCDLAPIVASVSRADPHVSVELVGQRPRRRTRPLHEPSAPRLPYRL